MPTARELIETVLARYLLAGQREQINRLTTTLDASTTSVVFDFDLESIAAGAKVAIELENMHVWSAVPATKTATVQRGHFGSTAATHTAGAIAYVNPKFSWFDVLNAINDELRSLSARGLFRVRTVDLTYNPSVQGYDLTSVTDLLSVYAVTADTPGPDNSWPAVNAFEVRRNASTGDFASGLGLIVYDAPYPGRTMRVQYRAPFGTLTTLAADLVTDAGLRAEARDIVEMGAALRLAAPRAIKRTFTEHQGDTRRAEEVSTTDALQAPGRLAAMHEQRINEEAMRLRQEYPERI